MSYTEIHTERGMPHGGIPHDELLLKLEETDPSLVDDVRGYDAFHDIEDDYDGYARGEIIDRAPDDVFLESDHTRRDPALSRTIINLRYSGGRGPNDHRLPQHPELFLGFTGNDPRGSDTQPRLDRLRAQTVARAREREVRMGHNVGHGDFIEADRPWGGVAMEYDKKEAQRRLKDYYRWFPTQKVGRPWGRNTVADEYYGLRAREGVLGDGAEGLHVPEQDHPAAAPLFGQAGGYDPATGATAGRMRRVDAAASADTAPWRHVGGDADLAVQRYGGGPRRGRELLGPQGTGGGLAGQTATDTDLAVQRHGGGARRGRELFGPQGTGGGLASQTATDADFGRHDRGQAVNRRALAGGMGAAAAQRRVLARTAGGDAEHGRSAEARAPGRTAPGLARDIAMAARMGTPDQAARAHGTIQDHEGGALGGGAGLAPAGDRQAALHMVLASHAPPSNARLGNAEAMVRGLREGSAAALRSVQGRTVAAGNLGTATGETTMGAWGGGVVPGKNPGAAAAAGEAPLARAAAAADLEVHNNGMAVPGRAYAPAAAAWAGGFASPGHAHPGRREGVSKGPEFRSHTRDPIVLGTHPDRAFGPEGVAFTGALSIGGKNLRASVLADGGDDVMGYRGFDGLGDGHGYHTSMGLQA